MSNDERKDQDDVTSELSSELVDRRAAREKRRKERAERVAVLEYPILERLKAQGYVLGEVSDAANKYAPLPDGFVEILLDALRSYINIQEYKSLNVLEMIIRALGAAAHPFDGRPLIECYDAYNDPTFRFAICNTIVLARPYSIDEWITSALQDPQTGKTLRDLGWQDRNARRQRK
ncbi:MAG: hypothetical protein U0793_28270 [Gemmataceae bacterium]